MWELLENRAIGRKDAVELEVSWLAPTEGIGHVRIGAVELSVAPLLGLDLPGFEAGERTISDVYVRGDDLIVRYAETADQVRTQVDWRLLPASSWAPWGGLELILSVQTQSLDARPRATARSRPSAATASAPRPGVSLFRLSAGEVSYVEMPGQGDVERTVTNRVPGDPARCDHETVFDLGRLEKGVIRRCRLRAYWLPQERDEQAVSALWDEFHSSPLPLTA